MSREPQPLAGSLEEHARVELELVEERASALGRAGERLDDAVEHWRRLVDRGWVSEREHEAALEELTAAAYALIVQRECTGFRFDNLAWIRRNYDIPEAVLDRL